MNQLFKFTATIFTLILGMGSAYAANTPKDLVDALSAAIEAKDISAASNLVNWGQAPISAYRMFKMSILDCYAPAKCKLEIAPLSDEDKQPQQDYFYPIPPEGKIKITPPDGQGEFSMPFAKVNNQLRIILGQQTKQSYADTKAKADATKLAQELDGNLLTSGQPLSADGGEPQKAFREYLSAIKQGDTQFLALHGTAGDRYFFGKAYTENPTKRAISLELLQMEIITDPKIKAGYVSDGRAMLLMSGTNGLGWTAEGAVTFELRDSKWELEDRLFLSYPPVLAE